MEKKTTPEWKRESAGSGFGRAIMPGRMWDPRGGFLSRLIWCAKLVIIVVILAGVIKFGGAALGGVTTAVKSGDAETPCDICGRAIREGAAFDVAPFSHLPWWEKSAGNIQKTATAIMANMAKKGQSETSGTETAEIVQRHLEICPDCYQKFKSWYHAERRRSLEED